MMSGPPILKTQFSIENMLSLNQQNLRLKAHVLLFLEKLEGFIGKAHVMTEEKRKQRLHINSDPPNEVLVQKQRELDSIQARIKEYRLKIKQLRTYFSNESESLDVMVFAENEIKNQDKVLEELD